MKSILLIILAIGVVLVIFKLLFKMAFWIVGLAAVGYIVYLIVQPSQPSKKQLPK